MITLEVGKKYKTRDGRIVKLTKHDPDWEGGMYWGSSIDKKRPKIDHERWTTDARWWDYLSSFSPVGYKELRDPDWDLVEEI